MPTVFPGGASSEVELGAEVADLIGDAARRMRVEANHALGALDVTWAQLRALRTCDRSAAPLRMSELADRLRIARRSATSVVDELESRRLVQRRPDAADRRAVVVAVTPAGRALLDEVREQRRAAGIELTATSGLDAEDLTRLRDLLRILVG